MKKICILCASDKPIPAVNGGAIETIIQNLIDENEKKQKFIFTVVTVFSEKIDYSQYKYTKFVTIPKKYLKINKIYWKIVGLTRKLFKYELLQPFQRFWEYNYLKHNYKEFDYIIEETDLQVIKKLRKILDKNIIYHLHYEGNATKDNDKSFDYLMPISEFIGKQWGEKTGRDKSTIMELQNAIDIKKFNKEFNEIEKEKLKEQLKIKKEDNVALYIGRIIPEKGVLEMLKAIEQLKLEDFKLILIGSANFGTGNRTKYEKEIQNYIKEMKTPVIQLGYIDNKEIYKYQNISDFMIIPSIWNEPAGLVVLEAQAAGLPIVASEIGGIPEFACPKAGILVNTKKDYIKDLSEAIYKMINMKDEYNEMSEQGKEWSRNFNINNYYDRFVEIIANIEEMGKKNED